MAENPQPYRAFSGANIYATIANRRVGTLQAITVSITREVAALYSFSDANPKTFVKGKRGIAGTLVFTQFDRHALIHDVFQNTYDKGLRDVQNQFSTRFVGPAEEGNILNNPIYQTRNFGTGSEIEANARVSFDGGVAEDITRELKDIYDMVAEQKQRYADQIPPFDITITMVNDAGDAAFCVIGGVQLVNEGWGYTIDDLVSEVAYTYVARGITPLTPIRNPRTGSNPYAGFQRSVGGQSLA